MGRTFDEIRKMDIMVRNFGFGLHLATQLEGARTVLMACRTEDHMMALVSADTENLLTPESANPVLAHIVELWNDHARYLRWVDATKAQLAEVEKAQDALRTMPPIRVGDFVRRQAWVTDRPEIVDCIRWNPDNPFNPIVHYGGQLGLSSAASELVVVRRAKHE